ncbi:MAG TPA: S9 family peptidase, partial [Candidatus Marinimicrobia bacterium]|nr:S9 family peptidase [Candidatus Neomarinimicrobiota bacterium]
PPMAQKIVQQTTVFGDMRTDYYDWLKEKDNPDVIQYLTDENLYADYVLKDTKRLQKKIYKEIVGRIQETDISVPVKRDNYYYYNRTKKGEQYSIYCRKEGSPDNKEEIILDANKQAKGSDYYSLGMISLSTDHNIMALSEDRNGSEIYTLRFKNLKDGSFYPEVIDSVGSGVWAADNKTFFYTTIDYTFRPWRVYRHVLGTSASEDELVYEDTDLAFFVDVSRSKDKAYLFISSQSKITSEVRYLSTENPAASFTLFTPRERGVEYSLEHHNGNFYILTNRGNLKNFYIIRQSVKSPSLSGTFMVYEHDLNAKINGMDMFKDFLVVYKTGDARTMIDVQNLKTNKRHTVAFPEEIYMARGMNNPQFDTDKLRIFYTSLLTPQTVYDYNMTSRELELLKQTEVRGGWNREDYVTELLMVPARDGAEIPVSILYKKGFKTDGSQPVFLYGYGSYGITMNPYFSYSRWSLVDRGFLFAIAHIRGGGAKGEYWYEEGKWLKKKNTFTDFVDVAQYLVDEKYTIPEKLTISGGSAGGLLMGTVVNMRPDLFGAVIASVPFVDVLNTMSDPSLPLTVTEYDEWGNPGEEEYYHYIRSYCPYSNVEAKKYPHIMVTAGLNDPRVSYAEPAKWTAKLRSMKTDDNILILRTNMGAGHGGASGRYDSFREIAEEYAFVLRVLSAEF